jgi:predicted RNA binding protein YcfA (HicA-like mRNA interferase family)
MKVSRKEVEKSLPKKGFRNVRHRHHIYYYHEYEGKETGAYTFLSHSAKFRDISGDILLSMKKQLRLETVKQVTDLMKCPIDTDAYNDILIRNNIFSPEDE